MLVLATVMSSGLHSDNSNGNNDGGVGNGDDRVAVEVVWLIICCDVVVVWLYGGPGDG